jgi:hypothetical protein
VRGSAGDAAAVRRWTPPGRCGPCGLDPDAAGLHGGHPRRPDCGRSGHYEWTVSAAAGQRGHCGLWSGHQPRTWTPWWMARGTAAAMGVQPVQVATTEGGRATGRCRLAGGRWWGAASASTPAAPGRPAGPAAAPARSSSRAAPAPGPPRTSRPRTRVLGRPQPASRRSPRGRPPPGPPPAPPTSRLARRAAPRQGRPQTPARPVRGRGGR